MVVRAKVVGVVVGAMEMWAVVGGMEVWVVVGGMEAVESGTEAVGEKGATEGDVDVTGFRLYSRMALTTDSGVGKTIPGVGRTTDSGMGNTTYSGMGKATSVIPPGAISAWTPFLDKPPTTDEACFR